MRRIGGLAFLVGAVLVAGGMPQLRTAEATSSSEGAAPATPVAFPFQGAISCAAAACHNAGGPRGTKTSEYTTWIVHDKHARAYEDLSNPTSKQIIDHLYGKDAPPATETKLCLQCHVHPEMIPPHQGQDAEAKSRLRQFAEDGVSCESCHGKAEKWRTEHYTDAWKSLSAADKQEHGFLPTKDLRVRAETCVRCHVGEKDMEVNHDLIAAGHPRLNFEFGAYHANLPQHWREVGVNARGDFQAQAWLTGQVVTAKAAVELLHQRASSDKIWPEFAEYNCFACHKELSVSGPEQRKEYYKQRHPGSFPYGTWYLTMLPLLEAQVQEKPGNLKASLEQLRKSMESPSPEASAIVGETRKIVERMGDLLRDERLTQALDATKVQAQLAAVLLEGESRASKMSWDEAMQFYFAAAAMHHALSDLKARAIQSGEPRKIAAAIGGRLDAAFPAGYASPRRFDPQAKSPPGKQTLAEQFKLFREYLGN